MKTRKSLLILLSLVFMLSIFVTACNQGSSTPEPSPSPSPAPAPGTGGDAPKDEEPKDEGPKYGGDLIYGTFGNPVRFNPLWANDTASSDIYDSIFAGLLRSNINLEPEPVLAKDWTFSDDGLTWVFNLRDDVKWHDGTPFTAEDVKFSFDIPKHPDYDGPRTNDFKVLESTTVIDPYTVEFKLSEPDSSFIWTAAYGVLPKHILGDVPVGEIGEHPFNYEPIGTGPFKFAEWKDGEYTKIVAFDDYFEGRPYIDSITYKIGADQNALLAQLQSGDINMMNIPATEAATADQMEAEGKVKISETLQLQYNYIAWNFLFEPFKDKTVRHALTHAINREEIVEHVVNGKGEVAHAPASPLSWAYNPNTVQFEYNPEKAKQMLADAGWTPGADGILEKDGQKLSFRITTNQGNVVREQIAVIIQENLKQIGVDGKPEIVEWSALMDRINPPNPRDFDSLILGWSLGTDPDPTGIWHTKEIELGNNLISYSRPDLDPLMDKNTTLLNVSERQKVVWEILDGIAEDQPYTFLYYPITTVAMPTIMKDYTQHPKNPFYNVSKWWLDID